MVAVKAADVDATLRRTATRRTGGIVLVYGPDIGLVSERAKLAAESAVEDPTDPFQLIRLDGDTLAADPARLADEASTIGLFGSSRAVWVKASSKNIAPAVELLLKLERCETPVVIEAGDLAKSSPLRTLCEKAKNALAFPCYADSGRDLGTVIDETLKAEGLTIGRDARTLALASLGGDRLATRGELIKLALYAKDPANPAKTEVTVADVEAILSDVSAIASDAVVDAAFAGQGGPMETDLRRLVAEGTHGSVILGAALRHAFALLKARLEIESGRPASSVVEGWRGLHFRRKAAVERHLGRFDSTGLKTVIRNLQTALLDTRRQAVLSDTITARALLQIASARGGGNR